MPIDLAPNHKLGLSVSNPILMAGGSIGYGEAVHPSLDLSCLGAVVVGPVLLHSRAGLPPPRLAQTTGGFLLETGLQNRGIDATLRNYAKSWPRLGCPVIVQVADQQPHALAKVVERLNEVEGVAGLELLLAHGIDSNLARTLVRTITQICDLPLWVKPALDQAVGLAPFCVQAEAVGLVIGRAAVGMLHSTQAGRRAVDSGSVDRGIVDRGTGKSESTLTASLYGPLTFPLMLHTLSAIASLQLDCALIACGGIHTPEQVWQALELGARAVQIDSAVWVEPGLPQRLVQGVGSR